MQLDIAVRIIIVLLLLSSSFIHKLQRHTFDVLTQCFLVFTILEQIAQAVQTRGYTLSGVDAYLVLFFFFFCTVIGTLLHGCS